MINIFKYQLDNKCFFKPCCIFNTRGEIERILSEIKQKIKAQYGLVISFQSIEKLYNKNLESRNKILTEILEVVKEEGTSSIGIYGMFGVGKTTLIEEVVRILKGEDFFHYILKVDVSKDPNNTSIQKHIADKIGLQLLDIENVDIIASSLYHKLKGEEQERIEEIEMDNKILVILDDIRSVIDLEKVGISYKRNKLQNVKVVLVSRCRDILQKMGVEVKVLVDILNMDEVKMLFRMNLGHDLVNSMKSSFRNYELVENDLLVKCRGSPLMIVLLVHRLDLIDFLEWEVIEDQLKTCPLSEVEKIKGMVQPILQSIEDFVGNAEKKFFFLLCCFSQPGTNITAESLVRYGIGMNLFEDNSLYNSLFQTQLWINELQSLSLLQATEHSQRVQICDLVEDMSSSIRYKGDQYVLHVETDQGWPMRKNYESQIAISMTSYDNLKFVGGLELPKLQCLWFRGKQSTQSSHVAGNFFRGMQNLKVLDISYMTFVDLSSTIQHLTNLASLKLEHCDIKDMRGISKLVNLKVFSLLESRIEVKASTGEIGELIKLKVLDLTCSSIGTGNRCFIAEILDALTSLSHLEELEITIPIDLVLVDGALSLSNLQRFKITIQGSSQDPTREFCSFNRCLILEDIDQADFLEKEGLQSLVRRSEYLLLIGIGSLAAVVPYLNREGFADMECIEVVDCKEIRCVIDNMFQPCLHFPKLKTLSLENLPNLYAIFNRSVYGEVEEDEENFEFSSLEKLKLRQLKGFRGLYSEVENSNSKDEGQDGQLLFNLMKVKLPFLRELYLDSLDKIEKLWYLPVLVDSNTTTETFSRLQILTVKDMKKIKHVWSNDMYEEYINFRNLKQLTISGCQELQSLCPPSVAIALEQLEILEIDKCDQMKEVISTEADEEINPAKVITFPKLQKLTLRWLCSLLYFYRGSFELQLPRLKFLKLHVVSMMAAFNKFLKSSKFPIFESFFSGKNF